jgi:hypothetical protein
MRAAPLVAALLLAGCASSQVVLLPGENGAPAGSVVLLDARTGVERVIVGDPNSAVALSGARPSVRAVDGARYEARARAMPPAPVSFTLYFLEGRTDLARGSEPVLAAARAEQARRSRSPVTPTASAARPTTTCCRAAARRRSAPRSSDRASSTPRSRARSAAASASRSSRPPTASTSRATAGSR